MYLFFIIYNERQPHYRAVLAIQLNKRKIAMIEKGHARTFLQKSKYFTESIVLYFWKILELQMINESIQTENSE